MAESLRDQLSANLDKLTDSTQTPEPETVGTETTSEPAGAEASGTTSAPIEKPGRTAGRARDEHGKLLPGKAQRPETSAAESGKASPASTPNAQTVQATPAAEPPKPINRPTTWKKETWALWDKVNKGEALTPQESRQFAEEAARRDGDYAQGVSTYKSQWDEAKPLIEAMAPFLPTLQQHNIQPSQWISNLGTAHQRLAMGSPQEKLSMFMKLAQDYQVPVGNLFVQGQDGKVYFNPQVQLPAPQQQQPQQQPDVRQVVQDVLVQERARQEVTALESNAEKYPHFDAVRETMAGLLQSGLATDLPSAYDAALRLPKHSDLYEADQKLVREAEEKRVAEEKRKAAEAARRNTVSTRSATPTAATQNSGAKGLRAALESNFEEVMAGRV